MYRIHSLPVKALLTLCSAFVLSGCTVTFVTQYDAIFDQEISSTQKDVDTLLTKIASSPSVSDPKTSSVAYASVAMDCAAIDTDFDGMNLRAGSHTDNSDTVNSVTKIKDSFDSLRSEYSTDGVMRIAQATDELKILNDEFQVIMAQEILKQQGK